MNDPQRHQGIIINGEVYFINSTGYLHKTYNFSTITYLDNIAGSGAMTEPYGMDWDEDNNVIHIAYHISNDMYYTNYSITNNTMFPSSDKLYEGGAWTPILSTSIAYLENNGTLFVMRVGATSGGTASDAIVVEKLQDGTPAWSGTNKIDCTLVAGESGVSGKLRFHENKNVTIAIMRTSNTKSQRRVFAYSHAPFLEGLGAIPDIGLGRWKPITTGGDKQSPNQQFIIYPDARIHVGFSVDLDGIEYAPRACLSYSPWTTRTAYDGINGSGAMWFRFNPPISTIYWRGDYEITDSNTLVAMKDRNFWAPMYQTGFSPQLGFYFFDGLQDFDIAYTRTSLASLHEEPVSSSVSGNMQMIDLTHGTYTPSGWTVKDDNDNDVNNTCIQNAQTLEEIKACIDNILDTDPHDPNPPLTDYPPDGWGALTRFNLRFYIWLTGWICIWAPLFGMAWRRYPLNYYGIFFITMLLGLGLLWSIGTI
jgi:hypothetical protein